MASDSESASTVIGTVTNLLIPQQVILTDVYNLYTILFSIVLYYPCHLHSDY